MEQFNRTISLIGEENIARLQRSHVAVFGIGGVGGFCVESLVRAGIGEISIIDHDVVTITNLNRQIIALHSTLNKPKVTVMKQRLLDINPKLIIHDYQLFYDSKNMEKIEMSKFDYIVDAIDKVTSKILLIENASANKVPIISSMGTGNRLNSQEFIVGKINQTALCPLAKVMRYELKKRGINDLKVLYSKELPKQNGNIIASISFVPSAAGLRISEEVINDLLKDKEIA